MQAVQGVSVDTVWQGKWVLLPPDREESSASDVTPAGRELGSHFETQRHSLVRVKDWAPCSDFAVLGWGDQFIFCGFLLWFSGYCISIFCFATVLFSWPFERAIPFFFSSVCPLWHFWITGFFSSLSVWYMMQKENPGNSPLCCSMGPRSLAGLPPLYLTVFFCLFYI